MDSMIENYVAEVEKVISENEFELKNPVFREEFLKSLEESSPRLKNIFEAAINHKFKNATLVI